MGYSGRSQVPSKRSSNPLYYFDDLLSTITMRKSLFLQFLKRLGEHFFYFNHRVDMLNRISFSLCKKNALLPFAGSRTIPLLTILMLDQNREKLDLRVSRTFL
jgi:hypothetical protein